MENWLEPNGSFAGMVYHRDSTQLATALVRDWIIARNWRSHSVDDALWRNTDGYSARFYPAERWRDLLLGSFEQAAIEVTGSDGDILPVPAKCALRCSRGSPMRSSGGC